MAKNAKKPTIQKPQIVEHTLDEKWLRFNVRRAMHSITDKEARLIKNYGRRIKTLGKFLESEKLASGIKCTNCQLHRRECFGTNYVNFMHFAYEKRREAEAHFDEHVFYAIRNWIFTGQCAKCQVIDNFTLDVEQAGMDLKIQLVEGTKVEVQGLAGKKEYNGLNGVIMPWEGEMLNKMLTRIRIGVLLENGKQLSLRPQNIKVIDFEPKAVVH